MQRIVGYYSFFFWPIPELSPILLTNCVLCNASVNSSCAHPPPGNCGAFVLLVSSGEGALAKLARPGGRTFAYPGATPRLLTRTWLTTQNQTWRILSERTSSSSQIGSSVKVEDWTNLWRFSRFYALISSLLVKTQRELSGTIDVNRRTYASLIKDFIIRI